MFSEPLLVVARLARTFDDLAIRITTWREARWESGGAMQRFLQSVEALRPSSFFFAPVAAPPFFLAQLFVTCRITPLERTRPRHCSAANQADRPDNQRQPVRSCEQGRFVGVGVDDVGFGLRAVEEAIGMEFLLGDWPEAALDDLQFVRGVRSACSVYRTQHGNPLMPVVCEFPLLGCLVRAKPFQPLGLQRVQVIRGQDVSCRAKVRPRPARGLRSGRARGVGRFPRSVRDASP